MSANGLSLLMRWLLCCPLLLFFSGRLKATILNNLFEKLNCEDVKILESEVPNVLGGESELLDNQLQHFLVSGLSQCHSQRWSLVSNFADSITRLTPEQLSKGKDLIEAEIKLLMGLDKKNTIIKFKSALEALKLLPDTTTTLVNAANRLPETDPSLIPIHGLVKLINNGNDDEECTLKKEYYKREEIFSRQIAQQQAKAIAEIDPAKLEIEMFFSLPFPEIKEGMKKRVLDYVQTNYPIVSSQLSTMDNLILIKEVCQEYPSLKDKKAKDTLYSCFEAIQRQPDDTAAPQLIKLVLEFMDDQNGQDSWPELNGELAFPLANPRKVFSFLLAQARKGLAADQNDDDKLRGAVSLVGLGGSLFKRMPIIEMNALMSSEFPKIDELESFEKKFLGQAQKPVSKLTLSMEELKVSALESELSTVQNSNIPKSFFEKIQGLLKGNFFSSQHYIYARSNAMLIEKLFSILVNYKYQESSLSTIPSESPNVGATTTSQVSNRESKQPGIFDELASIVTNDITDGSLKRKFDFEILRNPKSSGVLRLASLKRLLNSTNTRNPHNEPVDLSWLVSENKGGAFLYRNVVSYRSEILMVIEKVFLHEAQNFWKDFIGFAVTDYYGTAESALYKTYKDKAIHEKENVSIEGFKKFVDGVEVAKKVHRVEADGHDCSPNCIADVYSRIGLLSCEVAKKLGLFWNGQGMVEFTERCSALIQKRISELGNDSGLDAGEKIGKEAGLKEQELEVWKSTFETANEIRLRQAISKLPRDMKSAITALPRHCKSWGLLPELLNPEGFKADGDDKLSPCTPGLDWTPPLPADDHKANSPKTIIDHHALSDEERERRTKFELNEEKREAVFDFVFELLNSGKLTPNEPWVALAIAKLRPPLSACYQPNINLKEAILKGAPPKVEYYLERMRKLFTLFSKNLSDYYTTQSEAIKDLRKFLVLQSKKDSGLFKVLYKISGKSEQSVQGEEKQWKNLADNLALAFFEDLLEEQKGKTSIVATAKTNLKRFMETIPSSASPDQWSKFENLWSKSDPTEHKAAIKSALSKLNTADEWGKVREATSKDYFHTMITLAGLDAQKYKGLCESLSTAFKEIPDFSCAKDSSFGTLVRHVGAVPSKEKTCLDVKFEVFYQLATSCKVGETSKNLLEKLSPFKIYMSDVPPLLIDSISLSDSPPPSGTLPSGPPGAGPPPPGAAPPPPGAAPPPPGAAPPPPGAAPPPPGSSRPALAGFSSNPANMTLWPNETLVVLNAALFDALYTFLIELEEELKNDQDPQDLTAKVKNSERFMEAKNRLLPFIKEALFRALVDGFIYPQKFGKSLKSFCTEITQRSKGLESSLRDKFNFIILRKTMLYSSELRPEITRNIIGQVYGMARIVSRFVPAKVLQEIIETKRLSPSPNAHDTDESIFNLIRKAFLSKTRPPEDPQTNSSNSTIVPPTTTTTTNPAQPIVHSNSIPNN